MCVVYRTSIHEPKTAWARHLDQVMRARNWSRVELFEVVGTELGYRPKSRTAILPLLKDKAPTPAQAAVLRKHFGDPPPEPEPVVVEEPANLAAALLALTAELAAVRQERAAWERGVLDVLRAYRGAPVPTELLDALAPQPLEPSQP